MEVIINDESEKSVRDKEQAQNNIVWRAIHGQIDNGYVVSLF